MSGPHTEEYLASSPAPPKMTDERGAGLGLGIGGGRQTTEVTRQTPEEVEGTTRQRDEEHIRIPVGTDTFNTPRREEARGLSSPASAVMLPVLEDGTQRHLLETIRTQQKQIERLMRMVEESQMTRTSRKEKMSKETWEESWNEEEAWHESWKEEGEEEEGREKDEEQEWSSPGQSMRGAEWSDGEWKQDEWWGGHDFGGWRQTKGKGVQYKTVPWFPSSSSSSQVVSPPGLDANTPIHPTTMTASVGATTLTATANVGATTSTTTAMVGATATAQANATTATVNTSTKTNDKDDDNKISSQEQKNFSEVTSTLPPTSSKHGKDASTKLSQYLEKMAYVLGGVSEGFKETWEQAVKRAQKAHAQMLLLPENNRQLFEFVEAEADTPLHLRERTTRVATRLFSLYSEKEQVQIIQERRGSLTNLIFESLRDCKFGTRVQRKLLRDRLRCPPAPTAGNTLTSYLNNLEVWTNQRQELTALGESELTNDDAFAAGETLTRDVLSYLSEKGKLDVLSWQKDCKYDIEPELSKVLLYLQLLKGHVKQLLTEKSENKGEKGRETPKAQQAKEGGKGKGQENGEKGKGK